MCLGSGSGAKSGWSAFRVGLRRYSRRGCRHNGRRILKNGGVGIIAGSSGL